MISSPSPTNTNTQGEDNYREFINSVQKIVFLLVAVEKRYITSSKTRVLELEPPLDHILYRQTLSKLEPDKHGGGRGPIAGMVPLI